LIYKGSQNLSKREAEEDQKDQDICEEKKDRSSFIMPVLPPLPNNECFLNYVEKVQTIEVGADFDLEGEDDFHPEQKHAFYSKSTFEAD